MSLRYSHWQTFNGDTYDIEIIHFYIYGNVLPLQNKFWVLQTNAEKRVMLRSENL